VATVTSHRPAEIAQRQMLARIKDLGQRLEKVERLAGRIQTGAIDGRPASEGGHLQEQSITANSIASGVITAYIVLGNTILVGDPAGAKLIMDAAGLRGYATDGTTVNLNYKTLDGSLTMKLGAADSITAGSPSSGHVTVDSAGIRGYAADGTTKQLEYKTSDGSLALSGKITAQANSTGLPNYTDAINGATQITPATITGDRLTLTALDAKTITGPVIRTSATDPKVQVDTTGLFATDSGGNKAVNLKSDGSGLSILLGNATANSLSWVTNAGADKAHLRAWNPSATETDAQLYVLSPDGSRGVTLSPSAKDSGSGTSSLGAGIPGTSFLATILDSLGQSSFLQLASALKLRIGYGSATVHFPGGSRTGTALTVGTPDTPVAVGIASGDVNYSASCTPFGTNLIFNCNRLDGTSPANTVTVTVWYVYLY
jgi:hypothetical protein